MQQKHTPATLLSADSRLIHHAQACAAAMSVPITVVAEPEEMKTLWRTSPAVLIGSDHMASLAGCGLPARDQVYLLGTGDVHQELCRWSMPLGASVIVLPEGSKWLSRVIAGRTGVSSGGAVVAVRAGVGGVGASTLCAGLAMAAKNRSLKVALVDADPLGGGIDLLLGGESIQGWRWDKLRNAAGQIADITSMLPSVAGITVVSMERADEVLPPPDQAVEAVVDCLGRSHDLVLIDAGRTMPQAGSPRRTLVVAAATIRALAAARSSLAGIDRDHAGLVVRKPGSVSAMDASRTVGLPLVGVIPMMKELPRLADQGIPPWVRGWKKPCNTILSWCLGESDLPARAKYGIPAVREHR
ncbi:MAG: P-loop NTPase [Propionibacteriaceae bacterium]|nr:P-loop NTPase [Propionibacteriaceae bacterium]